MSISVSMALVEETIAALGALSRIIEVSGPLFAPFIGDYGKVVFSLMRYVHPSVREAAILVRICPLMYPGN